MKCTFLGGQNSNKKFTLFHDKLISNHIEFVLQTLKTMISPTKIGIETMIEDWNIPIGPNLTLLTIVGVEDPC